MDDVRSVGAVFEAAPTDPRTNHMTLQHQHPPVYDRDDDEMYQAYMRGGYPASPAYPPGSDRPGYQPGHRPSTELPPHLRGLPPVTPTVVPPVAQLSALDLAAALLQQAKTDGHTAPSVAAPTPPPRPPAATVSPPKAAPPPTPTPAPPPAPKAETQPPPAPPPPPAPTPPPAPKAGKPLVHVKGYLIPQTEVDAYATSKYGAKAIFDRFAKDVEETKAMAAANGVPVPAEWRRRCELGEVVELTSTDVHDILQAKREDLERENDPDRPDPLRTPGHLREAVKARRVELYQWREEWKAHKRKRARGEGEPKAKGEATTAAKGKKAKGEKERHPVVRKLLAGNDFYDALPQSGLSVHAIAAWGCLWRHERAGEVSSSERWLGTQLDIDRRVARKATDELIEKGYLKEVKEGKRATAGQPAVASVYRISHRPEFAGG